jgi:hypothetical protein
MTNDTMSGDYLNAITTERAAYQREYLRGGHSTHRQESLMDAHARKCARIIAQAYRAGDYSDMWRALSTSTRYDMCASSPITNGIVRHAISMAAWNDQRIDAAAFDCEAFTRAVHSDAASTQTPERPAGVWRLLDHLTGNANRGNSVAGINAAAIGERAATELTASGNLHALVERPSGYSNSVSGLAVGAYLAGQHRAHSFLTLAHVGRVIFQGNVETRYSVYPANYGIVHALCGNVTSAAAWWRQTIMDAEEQGDTKREVAARCAHMMLGSSLLERGELTPSDLATLIDTFQEQKLMKVRTKQGTYSRTMHVNDNRVMYDTLPFPIIELEKLIDYAAARMSAS